MNANSFSAVDRLERAALRMIMRLPTGLLLRAMGQKPIVIDGQTLHPEMQLCLFLHRLKKMPGMGDLSPDQSRLQLRRNSRVHGVEVSGVDAVDLVIPGEEAHYIAARHFRPVARIDEKRPLLVYFHGGGFVLGDIEMFDALCRYICAKIGFHVLSIDYRLAPEHPYPAGLMDALASFRWAAKNAESLGADPSRIAVGGDSAGANFAAIISQILAERNEPLPALQFLIYPTCDRSKPYPSEELFGEGFFLTKRDLEYFKKHYTGSIEDKEREGGVCHPWISPIHGKKLSGLPPAIVVTAGFDPIRDEGEAYVAALQAAGSEAHLIRKEGMIHGFINMIGFSPAARRAFDDILSIVKDRMSKI